MNPYYAVMKLPEVGKTEEFILMVPFTPARKNNMIAWMAARCDGADYGKVLVFTFPKEKLIYGPEQIQSRVNQNPSISQHIARGTRRECRPLRRAAVSGSRGRLVAAGIKESNCRLF